MTATRQTQLTSRRTVLAASGAAFLCARSPAHADPAEMREAMRTALGDAPLSQGRVRLDVPALVENGNSVPLTIRVDSPMTPADHVTSIYVFSPENPLPSVSRFILGPRNGVAEVTATIRLATTQHLHVVATMSDGSRWLATTEIEVTTAACFDPT